MRGKPADDPNPLRRGSPIYLLPEHPHGVGERPHTIPAQLHVVVQAATNNVHVAVDQAWNHAPALEIYSFRRCIRPRHQLLIGSDCHESELMARADAATK